MPEPISFPQTLPKTLLIGLGNPLLSDDGVGIAIASKVKAKLPNLPNLEIIEELRGGLQLMEQLIGFQRALIADAILTGRVPPGTVLEFTLRELPSLNSDSVHDLSLKNALQTGRLLGAELPADENVIIIAVEANDVTSFSEELSPEISKAVPIAVKRICQLLTLPQWPVNDAYPLILNHQSFE